MPTLVATVGAANSNSYITVADADTYFDERLNASAYTGADADDKARALIMATGRVDQERFEGEQVTTGQALKWPRSGATDDDGEEYADDAIPQVVLDATCEMALRLLNDGTTDTLANTGLEQFERAKVGALDVTLRKGYRSAELPDTVARLLRPVLVSTRYSRAMRRV